MLTSVVSSSRSVGAGRFSVGVSDATRLRLAAKAYAHTAQYDAMVASYLSQAVRASGNGGPASADFPDLLPLQFRKRLDLRYGENPHQQAAFYAASGAQGASVGSARSSRWRRRNSRSVRKWCMAESIWLKA